MGTCCGKEVSGPEDVYGPPSEPVPATPRAVQARASGSKLIDPRVIDSLVLELLDLIASYVDKKKTYTPVTALNSRMRRAHACLHPWTREWALEGDSPVSLLKLHVIADKEEGWFEVISSMVKIIPLGHPLGPSAITIVFDDCPLPSREQVIKLQQTLGLSAMRALAGDINEQAERNICVVLGCVADKLAGPNSAAVLTEETLDYMLSFLMYRSEPRILLFALIALEKFAHTADNQVVIKARLDSNKDNPLLRLENLATSDDFAWRQVGFCAKWALDNVFTVSSRLLSYQAVDMTNINALLNSNDASEYLKISCDGLEARCDSYSFESVRCTFPVTSGIWYYEVLIITSGVMQIGWATKNSSFLNHEGYGIGDDLYSLSYDGCRKLLWHEAKPSPVFEVEAWQPGDIVGCLIDMEVEEAIFSLNGRRIRKCSNVFETVRAKETVSDPCTGFFAAASFMAFQQCRFNFGTEPFKFPPTDRKFMIFNDHGKLTDEEKRVLPRRIMLESLRADTTKENACNICFDAEANCVLLPCGHGGFCAICTTQVKECPLCRKPIVRVKWGNA